MTQTLSFASWPQSSVRLGQDNAGPARAAQSDDALEKNLWNVCLPVPVGKFFTYRAPPAFCAEGDLMPGQLVQVPFGKRLLYGVIWQRQGVFDSNASFQIKDMHRHGPYVASPAFKLFLEKTAAYTMTPLGLVLKMALSSKEALGACFPEKIPRKTRAKTFKAPEKVQPQGCVLSPAQAQALKELSEKAGGTSPKPVLFEGVTGSGKTEVYLAWMKQRWPKLLSDQAFCSDAGRAESLSENQLPALSNTSQAMPQNPDSAEGACDQKNPETSLPQVLVLLPEISLTPQWIQRFQKRFGFLPVLWHAHLTPAQRRENWLAAMRGAARVIVGARSALFLPFKNLQAIVVDEEHDVTFKQEDAPIYHARDMAVLRGFAENIPVILASATPSFESLWNVRQKKYTHVMLDRRFESVLPTFHLLSLDPKTPQGSHNPKKKSQDSDAEKIKNDAEKFLSKEVLQKLSQVQESGGQSLVFLNRRGYAPFVFCRSCDAKALCSRCSAGLVFHKKSDGLTCHLCGIQTLKVCPTCGAKTMLALSGIGIEKLQELIEAALPQLRLEILSSDHASPKRLQEVISRLENQDIDVLIGTQMIAKGHHFPDMQFVAVLGIDPLLDHFDFRTHEYLFQLMTQVGGRAGRGKRTGSVWICTKNPDHALLQSIQKEAYHDWSKNALDERISYGYPPGRKIAAIILSCASESHLKNYAQAFVQHAPPSDVIDVLGPTPAPISFLRGRHRVRFLIMAKNPGIFLQPFLKNWLKACPPPFSLRLEIDIDPYSFL